MKKKKNRPLLKKNSQKEEEKKEREKNFRIYWINILGYREYKIREKNRTRFLKTRLPRAYLSKLQS